MKSNRMALVLAAAVAAASAGRAMAVNEWAGGTSGDMTTGSNWSGGLPLSTDTIDFSSYNNSPFLNGTLAVQAITGTTGTIDGTGTFTLGSSGSPGSIGFSGFMTIKPNIDNNGGTITITGPASPTLNFGLTLNGVISGDGGLSMNSPQF